MFWNVLRRKEMASKDLNIITTPALGRSFRLGMLYDRVHDNIIPGETLLTMKDMENHIFKAKKQGCHFNIVYGDSLKQKSRVYKGDANLELNILKGVAALGASGKFLKNNVSQNRHLRMALEAEYIMLYQELEMTQFESHISNAKTNATHIVAAIEYGTNVRFTFDRTLSEDEDELEIKGELKGMLDLIPLLKVSGRMEGSMSKIDKKKSEKISCTFCGDVILEENPTTYEDAVVCYKKLPAYLTEDKAVPVNVWLYPIPTQSTPANKVVQTINKIQMDQALSALEDLQRVHVLCNELMSGHVFALIPEVQSKIDKFRRSVQAFQEEFQNQVLGELLKEDDLQEKHMLPWLNKIANMKQWISQNAEKEVNLLSIYIKELKKNKIEILQKLAIDAKLFEHDNVIILDIVLPFSYGQYGRKEPGSSSSENRPDYEIEEESHESHDSISPSSRASEARKWYEDAEIKADIRKRIKRFVTLNSKENIRFEFFVTFTDREDSEPHYNIQNGALAILYENGGKNDPIDLLSPSAEERLCKQTED